MRILSLLPSATEIICSLGLADSLVAVTHECNYPPEVAGKPRAVESLIDSVALSSAEINRRVVELRNAGINVYRLKSELLLELSPDLVVSQDLCSVCAYPADELAAALRKLNPPPRVISLNPKSLEDILNDILTVGEATGRRARAEELVDRLRAQIERIRASAQSGPRPRALCLEWLDPPYCGGHWIPEMVDTAGGFDLVGKKGEPSFALPWEEILKLEPEVVLIMPCGFDLERTRRELARLSEPDRLRELLELARGVYLCDANAYFSRPGPRLVRGLEIMAEILHPEIFPPTWRGYCKLEEGPAPPAD